MATKPSKPKKSKKTARAAKPRKSPAKAKKPAAKPRAAAKAPGGQSFSKMIDDRIRSLGGWRAAALTEVRRLIREADPDVVEECKWFKPTNPFGVPVWSHDGILCTGESYKEVVKLTFMYGASLPDPGKLFNASLDGGTRRAIDIREGQSLDPNAFKTLIRAAIARNQK